MEGLITMHQIAKVCADGLNLERLGYAPSI